jgi:NAD-dependent SIR2 family protein deacetylase
VSVDDVAKKIAEADRVVFLTGAGLSVASGIAPYRKSKDAVWARFITEWGTMEKFHEDPLAWWNEFWIKAHGSLVSGEHPKPNAGHDAITAMVKRKPEHLVITQNIDGLHRDSGVDEKQLVEIHGRHDRFICVDPACDGYVNAVDKVDLSLLKLGVVPRCAKCEEPMRPLVLLFDEMYDSHVAYQMHKARRALNDADVVVFVGTSFSVGITDYAVRAAAYADAMLVNVNIESAAGMPVKFVDVLGPSEVTLPDLAKRVHAR